MKKGNASRAVLLGATWWVGCNGQNSLGSPPDVPNADGGHDGAARAGVASPVGGGPPSGAGSSSGTTAAVDASAVGGGCKGSPFDPRNCGACGVDCQGGACQGGQCVPLPAGVLATGQLSPTSIVADATNVYWVNEGMVPSSAPTKSNYRGPLGPTQILKCAKSGCNNRPTVLATANPPPTGDGGRLRGLAVDGSNVYWGASASSLMACAIQGCNDSPTMLHLLGISLLQPSQSPAAHIAREIAVAGGNVFTSDDNGAYGLAIASGTTTQLWSPTNANVWGVAADDARVYLATDFGQIVSCALGGCAGASTILVSANQFDAGLPVSTDALVSQLVIDGKNVYWGQGVPESWAPVNNGFAARCGSSGALPDGKLLTCAKAGCGDSPAELASALNCPTGLATDGTSVYFAELEYFSGGPVPALTDAAVGRIARCAVSGCSNQPTTLVANLNNPRGVALDAAHLYWTDFGSGGTIGPDKNVGGSVYSDDGRVMMMAR